MIRDLSAWGRSLVERFGDRPAAISERESLSFRQLDAAADDWAAAFASRGLGRGAHVGLLAGNGPQWLAVALGIWRAGATLVPISTFVTARELQETLAHAGPDALVLEPELGSHRYLEMLRGCRASLPSLRHVVVCGSASGAEISADDFVRSGGRSAATGLRTGAATPSDRAGDIDPESIACILYTSGTTGRPKGVMLSHRAILSTVVPTAARTGLTCDDTMLSSLPLFWVAGLVIRALPTLETGCALLLMPLFTPEAVVALLRRYQPTGIHLRPAQIGQILSHPQFDPQSCARIRRGGGRLEWYCPPLQWSDTRFITGYGMTEMAGYVAALGWDDPKQTSQSYMGSPLPGVDLKIANPDEVTGIGEICVRGPGLFSGYHREPPATGLDSTGYFLTGDLGRIDESGGLQFSGRSKDLLRVKGINVSPLEVEAVLQSHAGIENAYVVGIPFDGLDQTVVALLVKKPTATVSASEVTDLASEMLSHYKRPRHYLFISRGEVPLGGTSKPQRRALSELAAALVSRP
jgi:fatty-acyl-CoA synthase